jgi:hypothetical protein
MSKIVVLNAASALLADAPPVTQSAGLPPKPDLTLGYLPARSPSVFFEGALLDYLPLQVSCKGAKCSATMNAGGAAVGIIDPAGNQHSSLDYTAYYGQLIATEMIDPTSAVAQGSTLIEEDYWELQFSVTLPADTPFETDQAVTSGITETDTTTFSYTIGASISKLSASLTSSFQHTVAITNQESTTYKFQWPSRSAETTVGVYQLIQSFSVRPGSNLTAVISQSNTVLGKCGGEFWDNFCLKFESDAVFVYPTPTFLQAATTPPRPVITVGIGEIRQMVQRLISVK